MANMSNTTEQLECQELIQKLINNGMGDIVDALLQHETKCYTKKARLNKCGTCRVLGYKPKQLENALAKCRELLAADMCDD